MLKEIDRNLDYRWKFLQIETIALENWKSYETTSRVWNKNAVAWLLRHTQNQSYILIEQYRYPVKAKVLELVAWLIDKNWKTKEKILSEEINEETWFYDIWNIEFLTNVTWSAWKSSELTSLYDVEISGNKASQNLWEMEDIEVFEVEYKDFDKFLSSKVKDWILIDPKVCMAIYMTLNKVRNI